jgi:tetratricopeptide (TPR) repeat protein
MRIRTFLAAVVLASPILPTAPARADFVHLHDGTTLSGDIKRAADGWFLTDSSGKVTHIPTDRVKSIELAARGDPKDVAAGRLASLRRSVEALPDLKMVINRYEAFLEQNKDTPAAAEARKDLAQWRERQAKGMVRVGNKWVPPEERAALQEKAFVVVAQARDLLKQNKMREADATITRALEVDPTNASALYLRGLILYRQDQIPQARKAFEAVKEQMPDHGPALNNLAVVMWRQNQQVGAMNVYLQAMQAMPLNKELLNNVAEALNALTDEQRRSQVVQKVQRLWQEQDTQLQQQMMQVGWYRWGATWVDKAQYEKLQAAEREVKEKIAKLESDFAEAQQRIGTIDAQMRQNALAMRAIEANRYGTDVTGRTMVQYPLPPSYWEYDRAQKRLEVQRGETLALLDALRSKAQIVKQQLPVPKFTGAQLMIGVEGTPAIGPSETKPPTGAETAPPPANLKDEVVSGSGPAAAPATPGDAAKNPLDGPKPPQGGTADAPKPAPDGNKPPENPKAPETPKAPAGERPLKY